MTPSPSSPPNADLSVIIPVVDEARCLGRVLDDLSAVLGEIGAGADVIVGDGRGLDAVRQVAEQHNARYVRANSTGYGAATLDAARASRGEYVLTLDPDTDHIGDIVKTLWAARGQGDVVVGSRYVAGARTDQPPVRTLLSRTMNACFSRVLSTPVRDLSSGIRIHRRRVFDRVRLETRSLAFLLETLLKWFGNGVHVAEVPIPYRLHEYRAAQAHGARLGAECLFGLLRLWRMRNSVECADYDLRAFDSRIPLQRWWQRARHRIVMGFVPSGVSTVDVGCGSGRILADLPHAAGMDIRFEKLYFMSTIHRKLVHADARHLPFPDGVFQCVVCSEVIEHIPQENGRLVDEVVRVLAPGGTLVLGTPDYGSRMWTFIEDLYRRVAPNAYAHEHVTHYTHRSLRNAIEARGCRVVDYGYVFGSVVVFKAIKQPGPSA